MLQKTKTKQDNIKCSLPLKQSNVAFPPWVNQTHFLDSFSVIQSLNNRDNIESKRNKHKSNSALPIILFGAIPHILNMCTSHSHRYNLRHCSTIYRNKNWTLITYLPFGFTTDRQFTQPNNFILLDWNVLVGKRKYFVIQHLEQWTLIFKI